jgi:hypothetical protein
MMFYLCYIHDFPSHQVGIPCCFKNDDLQEECNGTVPNTATYFKITFNHVHALSLEEYG